MIGRDVELLREPGTPHWRIFSRDWIADALDLYRNDSVFALSATSNGFETAVKIAAQPYPFTKPGHITYVTTAMAAVYVSQAAFLHLRASLDIPGFRAPIPMSVADYRRLRDAGQMVIARFRINFHRPIQCGEVFELKMRHSHTRQSLSGGFAHLDFTLAEGSALGSALCCVGARA